MVIQHFNLLQKKIKQYYFCLSFFVGEILFCMVHNHKMYCYFVVFCIVATINYTVLIQYNTFYWIFSIKALILFSNRQSHEVSHWYFHENIRTAHGNHSRFSHLSLEINTPKQRASVTDHGRKSAFDSHTLICLDLRLALRLAFAYDVMSSHPRR